MGRAVLIVNPVAGKGRARRAAPSVRAALEVSGMTTTLQITDSRGAARRLAREALEDGCDALITLGGDGTFSEAVDGVLSAGAWPAGLAITPLPLGTGNSFVRHFGPRSGDWRAALDGLLRGKRRWIDAAVVRCDGVPDRHMVNVFGTGFMAHVAAVANRRFKWLGGSSYTAVVLWQLVRQAAPCTSLTLEGPEPLEQVAPLTLVAVCNTQWTGEDMWMSPAADPEDGLLDVLTLGPLSRLALLRLFPKIFTGTHVGHPAVSCFRAREVRIDPVECSPLLVDGEVLGSTPVTVRVQPKAVHLSL